jgi:hypothetical protein
MTIPSPQTAVPAMLWPPRNGDLQIVAASETHGRNHVGGPDASRDQPRTPVDGAVPHCTGAVVAGAFGTDQPASEPVDLQGRFLRALAADFPGRVNEVYRAATTSLESMSMVMVHPEVPRNSNGAGLGPRR